MIDEGCSGESLPSAFTSAVSRIWSILKVAGFSPSSTTLCIQLLVGNSEGCSLPLSCSLPVFLTGKMAELSSALRGTASLNEQSTSDFLHV